MLQNKVAITLTAALFSTATAYAAEWVRLADRHVGFLVDHDVIHVGRHDGKFTRLKLKVYKNDIELNSIKVVFGNGETEVVPFEHHIHDGGEADVELPHGWHEGRYINEVELHYHSRLNFNGEAIAELWGKED
jgi:hypothetical protein